MKQIQGSLNGETALRQNFRADINGLRAWAVIAVIFYHFGVPGFGGGFIGVDVFFVISGFLMTSIVITGLENDNFSLTGFYLARARRIVPALLALCMVLLGLGYFFLTSPDYKILGTHGVSSLGFFSNETYRDEAGYFNAASENNWLLHTWSLSAECQFYLILPILLMLAWRIRPGRTAQIATVFFATSISLLISIVATNSHPSFSFFSLHTRAWEMLAGGLGFLSPGGTRSNGYRQQTLEALGLAMILGSIIFFDTASAWPGWRAIVPVLGTMILLLIQRTSLWTGNRVAQWLGDRSYSIYLWHWPIYVALAYCGIQNDPLFILGGILLTAIFGNLSTCWIEVPARRFFGNLDSLPQGILLVSFVSTGLLFAFAITANNGMAGRLSVPVEIAANEANNFNARRTECFRDKGNTSPSCIYGKGAVGAIAIGDSHVVATVTSLAMAATEKNVGVMEWSYSGCVYAPKIKVSPFGTLSKRGANYQCSEFVDWVESSLGTIPRDTPVVLIGRYSVLAFGYNKSDSLKNVPEIYFSNPYPITTQDQLTEFAGKITDSACQLAKSRTVYMMRPIPEMGFDVPKTLSRRMQLGLKEDLFIPIEDYQKRNNWVYVAQNAARDRCGIKILDPIPYLCHDGRCYGSKNGRPLYFDDNHLSEFGNKLLVPMFRAVFIQFK